MTLIYQGECDSCLRGIWRKPDSCSTGYGGDRGLGARYCFQCCADHDRAYMRKHGRIDLYLSHGPVSNDVVWRISNWPGSFELRPTTVRGSKGYGFGGSYPRYDAWFIFDGYIWHGINAGDSQILRCKRTKTRWVQMPHGGYDPKRDRTITLTPVREIEAYAVIIRAIHERGPTQAEALKELNRRGLWLSEDQRTQARL